MREQQRVDAPLAVLGELIDDSHHTPPDRLASLVAEHARALGVREAVVYLATLEERTLRPLSGVGVPQRGPLDVDDSVGGRAFRTISAIETESGHERRLWLPLLDGTARLGVLELVTAQAERTARELYRQFAGVVAELIVSRSLYGDLFVRARRNHPVSLAAELQWSLLPPKTFDDYRISVSGLLEPAYDVAGDSFDYSFNGDTGHFAIFDAMGHGFRATMLATVAISAYRHGRRAGATLPETFRGMHRAVAEEFTEDEFVTAQLGELDAEAGGLRWLNAGHPPPMHFRRGRCLGSLECEPTPPAGIGGAAPVVSEASLEPDDRLLFYTDGVVEARSREGEFFGEERLADLMERADAAGLPAAETARRLVQAILAYQEDDLQDDATILLIHWRGPSQD
jgi:serine phosphatase RsbU (regulator of sigma subunit)